MADTKKLVIVESPNKVKSIAQYLGDGYEVMASVGHIRDLIEPKNLPPELKKGSLGKFSVDVENDFEPYYVVSDQKKKTVADLKRALKNADELLLATDEDREGEAIAWHLIEVLKPKVPVKRMVFHEITREAIEKARDNTRDIDTALVDAQETRRILDRLYGYEVSPVLWRKVGPGLSAGRVQSAATRLVVDRERERLAFVPASYWGLTARFAPEDATDFEARLARVGGERIATGRDFDDHGRLTSSARTLDESAAGGARGRRRPSEHRRDGRQGRVQALLPSTGRAVHHVDAAAGGGPQAALLRQADHERRSVALRERLHHLYANRLRVPVAAGHERGPLPGSGSCTGRRRSRTSRAPTPPRARTPRRRTRRSARPVRPSARPPSCRTSLRGNEFRLYDLIWKRTVASQMADAKGQTASVTVRGGRHRGPARRHRRRVHRQRHGDHLPRLPQRLRREQGRGAQHLRRVRGEAAPARGRPVARPSHDVEADGHETTPPPRYTEASLVKALEELGIGRPSTFASIISTIVDRGYVTPRGQALVPSWVAFSVVRLLEDYFGDLVQYDFTAEMEDDLDRIADGEAERVDWLNSFYFGSDKHKGLRRVIDNLGEIDARSINSIAIDDGVTLRIGKYGPYLEVVDQDAAPDATPRRVNIPPELAPDELTPAKAHELIEAPVLTDRVLGVNPENGKNIVAKDGRFGPYVTEARPRAGGIGHRRPADGRGHRRAGQEAGEEGRCGEAAHRIALQVDGPRVDRPRRRR